jgi:hypothetical protein
VVAGATVVVDVSVVVVSNSDVVVAIASVVVVGFEPPPIAPK